MDPMPIELWRTTRPAINPLSQVLDRLFEQSFVHFTAAGPDGGSTGFQSLPVNVWETEDGYHAALMAPGLDEETIKLTVHEDTLLIEGRLAFPAPDGAQVVWQEFNSLPAKFRRSLRLGAAVDAAKVEAVYRNGLLVLTMPKAEYAKPRQIHLKVTSGDSK
jgi:HSP20 family protein